MGNSLLSLIIAAIVILVHVGTVLAKYAEKKKKEEAARRTMEARRMQERGLGIELPGSGTTPTMGGQPMHHQPAARPIGGQTISRVDELAARRQAQLEQLRQRRDTRRAGSLTKPAGASVRTQGHAPTTPPSQQMRGMRPDVRIEDRSHEDVARREAQLKRQRELQERQKAAEARAAEEREEREHARLIEQRRQASRKASGRTLLSGNLTEGISGVMNDPYGRATAASFAAGVQRQLKNRGSLREVLVLKEVLDPPLAMRDL